MADDSESRETGLAQLKSWLTRGALWGRRPPPETPTAAAEPRQGSTPAADPGLPSHRYVDLGEIGEGGMGSVRRIRDRALRREVALKQLDPRLLPEEDRVLRFVEEAQITGQLDHPNIVSIHDLGRNEDGGYHFSMKLVEGKNLEEVIEEAGADRLSPDRLVEYLEILVKVCEAVAFAHSRGVIHRDLKPANIMVGEFGQVYVMDWGVARLLGRQRQTPGRPEQDPQRPREADPPDAEGPPAVRVTRKVDTWELDTPGTVIGTPGYMAPEQVAGQHHETDELTDVFALGGTLYHVLTGRPPYVGRNYYNLLVQALTCEPQPPAEVVTDGTVPPGLARIAMKAMSADPAERYPSVLAMRRELERFLRGAWHLPTRTYAPGEPIVVEGDEGDAAYIITEGHCVVRKRLGDEDVELRQMGPGDVFGEIAIFSATTRTATVEAVDEVTVMVVDRDALSARFELNSWMGRFVRALADRFQEVEERLQRRRREE